MRYVRVYATDDGSSHFEDVDVTTEPKQVVDGVPPLLLSDELPVAKMTFVEQPEDAAEWEPHVTPSRRWVIVLEGQLAVTVSSGEQRVFGPGGAILAEDTTGEGTQSTPLSRDLKFVMIPTD